MMGYYRYVCFECAISWSHPKLCCGKPAIDTFTVSKDSGMYDRTNSEIAVDRAWENNRLREEY